MLLLSLNCSKHFASTRVNLLQQISNSFAAYKIFVNLSPETSLEVLKHLARVKLENLRLTNLEFNNFIVSQKRYLPVHEVTVSVEWYCMVRAIFIGF